MYEATLRAATQHNTNCIDNNKNINMSSFKSRGNIQKKENGPYRSVSNNNFSSVTLNKLAMKDRENIMLFRGSTRHSNQWPILNQNGVRIPQKMFRIFESKPIIKFPDGSTL